MKKLPKNKFESFLSKLYQLLSLLLRLYKVANPPTSGNVKKQGGVYFNSNYGVGTQSSVFFCSGPFWRKQFQYPFIVDNNTIHVPSNVFNVIH